MASEEIYEYVRVMYIVFCWDIMISKITITHKNENENFRNEVF